MTERSVSDFSWHFSHGYGTTSGAEQGCDLADSAPVAGKQAGMGLVFLNPPCEDFWDFSSIQGRRGDIG